MHKLDSCVAVWVEPESALSTADTVAVAGIMANVTRDIMHRMPEMLKATIYVLVNCRECNFTYPPPAQFFPFRRIGRQALTAANRAESMLAACRRRWPR